jgi:polyhydroxyalkanoate synthesis regulator phasin
MKKLLIALTLIFSTTLVFGSEMDRLVEKLVEKGILTQGEAYKIAAEAKEESRKQEAMVKGEIDKVPGWIKNTKFKGDARLRFEQKVKNDDETSRRGRVRARWGFETQVNPQLKVGLRIASGSSDQTSTNQSFKDSFSTKALMLDKAYATYSPIAFPGMSITGGKMSNPFYKTDLVWDGDITPEGVAVCYKAKEGLFVNTGFFPMNEAKHGKDALYLLGAQVGFNGKIADKKFNAGVAYYFYENLKGQDPDVVSPAADPPGNTLVGGNYAYDYTLLDFNVDFTPFEIPAGNFSMPVKFKANYVVNTASDVQEESGYLLGFDIGKASKKGSWKFGYNYRNVGADCVPAFINDSDMNGGGTDLKGHKVGFAYALNDNSTLGVTYLMGESLEKNTSSDLNTLQVDYIVKF